MFINSKSDVTFQTANVPLTQGYNVSLRQPGFTLDDLVHTYLCCMGSFIGRRRYGIRDKQPVREDDFASSLQIGIAQFPRSALKPLEAQGRGYAHGHENHFRAANESCASKAVVYKCRCYRARRRRTEQMVPAGAGSGDAGGLYFAI